MVSVESLLCEVSPFLEVQTTLKAADELFFGDTLLHHPCSNEAPVARSGEGRGTEHQQTKSKDSKKGKRERDSPEKQIGSHEKSDGLREAIASAKETLKRALEDSGGDPSGGALAELTNEVATLKKSSDDMKREIEKLRRDFQNLLQYVQQGSGALLSLEKQQSPVVEKPRGGSQNEGFDLFGSSDDEDVEKERIKQERLRAYAEKKAKKPETVAKSSVILDVKPWDDTTNMQEMEKLVRAIEKDGLVWGGAKLKPLAYGIKVLQIICVVEDEKVSVDDLIEQITEEVADHVQSVDVVAFNKI